MFALAVYFLHSTRLVSRDRHWLPATDCCLRYLPCCQPAFHVTENLGDVSCTECTVLWVAIPTFSPVGTFRVSFLVGFVCPCIMLCLWRVMHRLAARRLDH